MVEQFGITTGPSISYDNDIFARPIEYSAVFTGTLKAVAEATQYKRGQLFSQDETGKYVAVADATAFSAATTQTAILLHDRTVDTTDSKAVLIARGNFIQQRLIPNNIPLGAYKNGTILIEEEID